MVNVNGTAAAATATTAEEVALDGTKKKKLTGLEKSDGRRLVEYLVVVSSIPRVDDENAKDKGQEQWNLSTSFDDEEVEVLQGFKPQITARYPLYDHEDNPLHENVTFFCHPSGAIHLKKEDHMPKVCSKIEYPMFSRMSSSISPLAFGFLQTLHLVLHGSCLLYVSIGPLLCCHGWNRSSNVWNLFDPLGALHYQRN